MNKLKSKIDFTQWLSAIGSGKFLLVIFCLSLNFYVSGQALNDLNPGVQASLEELFEGEIEKLRDEVLNPTPGVSIESNRNLHSYYQTVWAEFEKGNLDLRTSFVSNLAILFQGPVFNHPLTAVLFTGPLSDSSGDKAQRPSNYQGNLVFLMSPAPLTPEFEQILEDVEVIGNDISAVEALFEFIKENK